MSDSIQYGSFRNPLYRDYEKFPYGSLENPLNSPPKSSNQQVQKQQQRDTAQGKSKSKSSKDSCPFCKEQKKRPLGAYLRKRGQRITSESISEDVEECLEEGEEPTTPTETPTGSPTNNELAAHNHHHQHEQVVAGGRYSRQESNDSDGK